MLDSHFVSVGSFSPLAYRSPFEVLLPWRQPSHRREQEGSGSLQRRRWTSRAQSASLVPPIAAGIAAVPKSPGVCQTQPLRAYPTDPSGTTVDTQIPVPALLHQRDCQGRAINGCEQLHNMARRGYTITPGLPREFPTW